jgi:hypothetical protein
VRPRIPAAPAYGSRSFRHGLPASQTGYVLEDNDAAGRKRSGKVIAALRNTVSTIAVVSFPELPEGGDVSDWLELGGNRQLLIARAEEARKRAQRLYIITNIGTVEARAHDWLWPGHLARGGLELLAGPPEIGKSQVHCQYITCVTARRTDRTASLRSNQRAVILLTAEDSTS